MRLDANRIINVCNYKNLLIEQVCVEPPPSAFDITLPAFAAERRRLQHGTRSWRSISPANRARRSKPAVAVVGRWDKQTDRQTDERPAVT